MTVKELHSMLDKYIGTAVEDYQVNVIGIEPDEDNEFVTETQEYDSLEYLSVTQRRKEF